MSFTADQVEEIVKELMELKKTHSVEDINGMTKFDDFKLKNKVFYNTILSDDMDMEIFKQMMFMKRKLESGEEQYSVDVKFGKYMSDKYIEPVKHTFKKNDS
jgi:hypothetical protein